MTLRSPTTSWHAGAGPPAAELGTFGDFYVDTAARSYYGPKSGAGWGPEIPMTGVPGPPGERGVPGADGRTVLSGSGAPAAGTGVDGDFYLDSTSTNYLLYGPKTAGAWGSGFALKGQTGATGAQGAAGTDGRGFNPRGPWAAATAYAVDDVVTHGGATYRVRAAHTSTSGATPDTDAANYEVWAAKGEAAAAASETVAGIVELATPAETQAGTDSARAVHPAGLASALSVKLAPPAVIAPSLTSGWVNFGGGEAEAGYYKDALGVVRLAGVVKSGSTGAATAIFTLPSGHRPALIERFSPYNAGSAPPTVKVFADGRVEPTVANNAALSLSGITFRGI